MEQITKHTKFSLEFLKSRYEYNKDFDRWLEKTKIENEFFSYWTFANSGDYRKNLFTRVSCNFIPKAIYVCSIPENKEDFANVIKLFTKHNKHFIWAMGNVGWMNDDFVTGCNTIEILIDIEQTK